MDQLATLVVVINAGAVILGIVLNYRKDRRDAYEILAQDYKRLLDEKVVKEKEKEIHVKHIMQLENELDACYLRLGRSRVAAERRRTDRGEPPESDARNPGRRLSDTIHDQEWMSRPPSVGGSTGVNDPEKSEE